MPRMTHVSSRAVVVALTLAVAVSLLAPAAQALPLPARSAFSAPASVDTIVSVWNWFTNQLAAAIRIAASPAQPPVREKDGGGSDPLGGSMAQPGSLGSGIGIGVLVP